MRVREDWEHAYQLYVDGKKVDVQLLGSSKSDAYKMLDDQWRLSYPDKPIPAKRRCKLEKIDSTFQGYIPY